jgi:hypothetical protein
LLALLLVLFGRANALAYYNCDICSVSIEVTSYSWMDKVTNLKKRLCYKCIELPDNCSVCSLPVLKDFKKLDDGRAFCARDVKSVVFDDVEAGEICTQTKSTMDRVFSRFLTLPEDNFTVTLVDRINLITLFDQREYECPNVLGYIYSRTNRHGMEHDISLMSGLQRGTLKTTFAHECAHAWVAENVSSARRETMRRDAEEGFCELIAFMLAESLGDEEGKQAVKMNGYTRGQFALFREAEKRFGFSEILDWMKYGVDDSLRENDLVRVRAVEIPAVTQVRHGSPPARLAVRTKAAVESTGLVLNGITWSSRRPTALINNRTFHLNEQAHVKLGTNSVTIRCLSIQTNSVSIQNLATGENLELRMKQ